MPLGNPAMLNTNELECSVPTCVRSLLPTNNVDIINPIPEEHKQNRKVIKLSITVPAKRSENIQSSRSTIDCLQTQKWPMAIWNILTSQMALFK